MSCRPRAFRPRPHHEHLRATSPLPGGAPSFSSQPLFGAGRAPRPRRSVRLRTPLPLAACGTQLTLSVTWPRLA
eukprot:1985452-Lingulodinium_polyedra.AAC.1